MKYPTLEFQLDEPDLNAGLFYAVLLTNRRGWRGNSNVGRI
jgi:hypothetical protein